MILSTLFAFGLFCNHQVSSKLCYFNSGASNHMTNIVVPLFNVRNYDKSLKINTVDGSSLPISVVGDLSSSLTDVLCLLTSPQILFLLVNWLIIIVMSISPILVILCRIKCQGKWSRRGLKWDDSYLFTFILPL